MSNAKAIAATARKRRQRQRDEARYAEMDIKRIEVQLSANERKWLDEIRAYHGGYDVNECMATLIRRAYQTMQETKSMVQSCQYCGKGWPDSCNGQFKGHRDCFLTQKARELAL